MVSVSFVDSRGVRGVIHNDLTIEADGPVDEELRVFVRSASTNYRQDSPTLEALTPEFLIDLYVHTAVRKVEPIPDDGADGNCRLGGEE
ncbi:MULTISPECIES: hypothetical protein [Saliphagus]|uniref:Uncharacterized protein n=1 Tax=Saliphagus infecundisoli TaxID=1849069 RepID=A0ABD5QJS4_9EURY|nr:MULTISPECIES: hypothetical protein [Saliphagus]